jgi:SAM-dependent methyltransferase
MGNFRCNYCNNLLTNLFVDLGTAPLVSSYIKSEDAHKMEPFYILKTYVCDACLLVQLPHSVTPEALFGEYPYFSSSSTSWLKHSKDFVEDMVKQFNYNKNSLVVEIASNDGYLLQYFKEKNIPVLGIEPAKNVAQTAILSGIPTRIKFFGIKTAQEEVSSGNYADLIIGNNVLAHVPNLNDFVGGLKILLKPKGIISMEFPHLYQLINLNQFDTIFHEHFSYLSLITVEKIFADHKLMIFNVDEIPTHGGSLRIYATHSDNKTYPINNRVSLLREKEEKFGLRNLETYSTYTKKVHETKFHILEKLIDLRKRGKSIVGYGAPGKGCILLNYCGIRTDLLDYTVDINPHKQGYLMPGVRIPIYDPSKIKDTKPDYVFILPWNLKKEITEQLSYIREWGGKFIVPIPDIEVF